VGSYGTFSPGWWAMLITMTADATAFASLVFGYFFYWTIHAGFPADAGAGIAGPDWGWPMVALALLVAGWLLTLLARGANGRARYGLARSALCVAAVATAGGGAAALAGPWAAGLEPTLHVYPAIVWVLAGWVAVHAALGVVMHLYVLARSLAGRLDATHDNDIGNIAVYQHFLALSAVVTFPVIAFFPGIAR